jgi:hypothetical protein
MATTRHYWVCPRCQTPNAVGVARCRACNAEAVEPTAAVAGGTPPVGSAVEGQAGRSVTPAAASPQAPGTPPGAPATPVTGGASSAPASPAPAAQPGPPVVEPVGRRSHTQITRCPRCGMTHQGLVWFCERCGLDILGRGAAPSSVAAITAPSTSRPSTSRSPLPRLIVLAILLVGFAVVSAYAVLEIADRPNGAVDRVPEQAVLTAPEDGSPAPVGSSGALAPVPPTAVPTALPPATQAAATPPAPAGGTAVPATPSSQPPASPATATAMRTISGALTIVASAGSPDGQSPWKPASGVLAPASRDPGVDGPLASPGAAGSACVGAGAFKAYAPGRTITILDDAGQVVGTGELQAGSITSTGTTSGCRMPFTIAVPLLDRYTINVGTGTLSYSRAGLEARDWTVELEIAARP